MFRFDEGGDIVVRHVFRFRGDECRSITEIDLKELDRDICRHETVSFCGLFRECRGLTSIVFPIGFNTSNVTDTRHMFSGCRILSVLDLSTFDTSSVQDMSSMFCGCGSLSRLDLSTFNTGNVQDMCSMFKGCRNLSALDLSTFNTSNVRDMRWMFRECTNLSTLDLSTFNTSNATNMNDMFSCCSKLNDIEYNMTDYKLRNAIHSSVR